MIDSSLISSQFANPIRGPGMKYLVIADRHAGTDPVPYADEENRRVRELTEDRTVEYFYLKADRSGAVFILEAESLEGAKLAEALDVVEAVHTDRPVPPPPRYQ
jgi:hypothetical protein